MAEKISKSEGKRIKATKPLKIFFYPNVGPGGITAKAATKEEADLIARNFGKEPKK